MFDGLITTYVCEIYSKNARNHRVNATTAKLMNTHALELVYLRNVPGLKGMIGFVNTPTGRCM